MIPLIHSRRRAPVYLCAEDGITSPDWPVSSSIACDVNLSGFPREEVLEVVVHYGPKTRCFFNVAESVQKSLVVS